MEKNTIDTTDRISTLPVFIVHHILSYLLKNSESLVRMSVLSKEWFAITTSFPILYFHIDDFYLSFSLQYNHEYMEELFYRYVEYIVSRFCAQNVSAHTLDFYGDFLDLGHIQLFGHCLELVLGKGLQVLEIDVGYLDKNLPMFRLPNTLLSASSLTSLTLIKCELPSSLTVAVVQLKSLRLLSLSHIPIDEGVIEHLTKGCPLLEEMFIWHCYGFRTFCVKRHHSLHKLQIYSNRIDRVDVDAPNLSCFLLENATGKAIFLSLDSCKKLATFAYRGLPLKKFNDLLSNFPFIENVLLDFASHVGNLKLTHHFLKRLELRSNCNLEEIDLNAPNLLMFEYGSSRSIETSLAMSRKDSSLAKGCMKCCLCTDSGIFWFQKLRRFLEKSSIFKDLKLVIKTSLRDVEELKLIESPPYKLEHVKLKDPYFIAAESPGYLSLVDAVLWCCRPRSLTLEWDYFTDTVIEYTYQKLLQQEDEGQTNIKFVVISSSKDKRYFSDLNSLLKELSVDDFKITFIKEEVVQDRSSKSDQCY